MFKSLKHTMLTLLWVVPLILVSYYVLDAKIALFIKQLMRKHSFLVMNIPDLLFGFVSVLTASAAAIYFYNSRRGDYSLRTRFFQILALSAPIAYLLKSVLKYVFGSVNTHYWLRHPGKKDFSWFQGGRNYDGFPSGHMAVFTALLLTTAVLYPRYRYLCYGSLLLLATALVVTNYHFLSDVIAGAFLGAVVHAGVSRSIPVPEEKNSVE